MCYLLFSCIGYRSTHLLGEITTLLIVYKHCIPAIGDCITYLVCILAFVCKSLAIFANFQPIDNSARWLTSFKFHHTLHAGTRPSTGPY